MKMGALEKIELKTFKNEMKNLKELQILSFESNYN